jgi:Lon protease-like protein
MESDIKNCNLFPLGIFVLPGGFAQLHIFEPRYKALVNHTLEAASAFGILTTFPENEPNLGTLVRIVEVTKRYPDGRMDILIKGESLFQLVDFEYASASKPYPHGTIIPVDSLKNRLVNQDLAADFEAYATLYHRITGEDISLKDPLRLLDLAGKLQLDESDKLRLALIADFDKQQQFLRAHIYYLYSICQQEAHRYLGFYLS